MEAYGRRHSKRNHTRDIVDRSILHRPSSPKAIHAGKVTDVNQLDCLLMAPEPARDHVPTLRNHLSSMATHLQVRVYVGDMSMSNGGTHAVRAEWGNVPSMSYVSNFASILRKKTRNCVAFEQKKNTPISKSEISEIAEEREYAPLPMCLC